MGTRPVLVFHHKGDLSKTDNWLKKLRNRDPVSILKRWGEIGVDRLAEATPKDTGVTAQSWSYLVTKEGKNYKVQWFNSSKTVTDIPIVILLQYGHGTRGGTYVEGRDFINPTLRPIFEKLADDLWKEVRRL